MNGCGQRPHQVSAIDVTDVHHTPSKRQSIGNCWLYATATWVESLALTETNESHNISETYWTYWHWYDSLRFAGDEINTGGNWDTASSIIARYGWMEEGEFLPGEADLEMSAVQAHAENFVNLQLAEGGQLADFANRTPEKITAVLDEAFGVKMAEMLPNARKASDLFVGHQLNGEKISLAEVIDGSGSPFSWSYVRYPGTFKKDAPPSRAVVRARNDLLRRVMKALNDRQPVIISIEVDFNALRTEPYATFDAQTLAEAGAMGRQGGHLLVLEDYTVKNVPGVGEIGEGDVSDELKNLALQGDLTSLKAKNSWGTGRPERGLTDGHTAFTRSYLDDTIAWKIDEDGGNDDRNKTWRNALRNFVLPPGY
jgi:hypothetical protein